MPGNFITLQKRLLITALLYIALFGDAFAQQTLSEAKANILTVRDLYFKNTDHTIDAVTAGSGHPELWALGPLDGGTEYFRISSYHEEKLFTELYLLNGGRLVYALEEIKRMPLNHYTESVWRCEYFIRDGKVIDYSSLGHGKTEVDAWDPESILIQFAKRKAELEKICK